ncbi:MAG TPA: NAD(P)/FAD-dependent oxidoreductase [Nitrospinota bacterium]|nr:NAD(P)/FAD-dependent oxidoreductase [Nitrospinota bacterium]
MPQQTALIIGAGPAGLTAANELLNNTNIKPIVFEATSAVGGISRTVNFKGNRIDIGGHRFFSKSERIMDYWQSLLAVQGSPSSDDKKLGREIPISSSKNAPDPEIEDKVLLIRKRLSRILYLRKFFNYPISLNTTTLRNLGLTKVVKIGFSYIWASILPIKEEKSLEDFFINRFGRELYSTFFKNYTQKVWGVPCDQIKPEWGAQRIKGLSIASAIVHAIKSAFTHDSSIAQKNVETSLIDQFLYPKHGPGQLWEELAERIISRGGEINMDRKVVGITMENSLAKGIEVQNGQQREYFEGDYVISTMPVRDLIKAMSDTVPENICKIADGLMYRDFITVGLLLKELKIKNNTKIKTLNGIVPDSWIYIQEDDVKVGRLQIFNNWSPYLVKDKTNVWLGLEYFCNEGDELWSMDDDNYIKFAVEELVKIDVIERNAVIDGTVIRVPKTYPAYFGTFDQFDTIRKFVNTIHNLFLIGRNGMHRYNNMDHSMLAAIQTVENIRDGITSKENIWSVNAENDYHEEKNV